MSKAAAPKRAERDCSAKPLWRGSGGFKGVINMISLRKRMEIVPNNTNRDRPVVDLEAGDERLMASYQPCSAAIVAPVADVASNLDPLTGDESRTDHPCSF